MAIPEPLHIALRQYRHNNSDEFVFAFDEQKTLELFESLQSEVEYLRYQLQIEQTKIFNIRRILF